MSCSKFFCAVLVVAAVPTAATAETVSEARRACRSGKSDSCFKLGQAYRLGKAGLRKSESKAFAVHQRACDRAKGRDLRNCLEAQRLRRHSLEITEAEYHRHCSAGDHSACWDLGVGLLQGTYGLPKKTVRGRRVLKDLCKRQAVPDNARACRLAADSEKRSGSPSMALLFYERGCNDYSHPASCNAAAVMKLKGARGVKKDMTRAIELALRGCERGRLWKRDKKAACGLASWLLYQARRHDESRAAARKGCPRRRGHRVSTACEVLGHLALNQGHKRDARVYFGHACRAGAKTACKQAKKLAKEADAKVAKRRAEEKKKRDEEKAALKIEAKREQRKCDRGDEAACVEAAMLYYQIGGDTKRLLARSMLEDLCEDDQNAAACTRLAFVRLLGCMKKAGSRNSERKACEDAAESAFKSSCRRKDAQACVLLGKGLFPYYSGVSSKDDRAMYLERACSLDPEAACED